MDNIEYTRHNTEKKQNKNKAQKTKSATIMNGQPETLATLSIQDTTRRQTKKMKIKHRKQNRES